MGTGPYKFVRYQRGDRLEDALCAVSLTRVHRLVEEVGVRVGVGLLVVDRGETVLLSGEIEPDDGNALLVTGPHRLTGDLEAGESGEALAGQLGEGGEEVRVVGRELLGEGPERADHDAVAELRLVGGDLGVDLQGGPPKPVVHRAQHPPGVHPGVLVELGSEAHLHVAHPLGEVVLGELVGNPLERRRVLHDGTGPGETGQVLGQVGVVVLEDGGPHAGLGVGGQGHAALPRQLDQRGETERTVEVDVEIGLGEGDEKRVEPFGGE